MSPGVDVADWVLRFGVALFFLIFGLEKFEAASRPGSWAPLFAQIGLGDWFRTFTGALEVGGAFLFMIPRTVPIATIVLASTMAGAVAVHLLVIRDGFAAIVPAMVLAGVVVIGLRRRGEGEPG